MTGTHFRTVHWADEGVPRPPLHGVAPADIYYGTKKAKQTEITQYQHTEQSRPDIPPRNRDYSEILSSGLQADRMTAAELLAKLAFLCRTAVGVTPRQDRERAGQIPMAFRSIYLAPLQLLTRRDKLLARPAA